MPQQQIDLYRCPNSTGGITTDQATRVRSTLGITDIVCDISTCLDSIINDAYASNDDIAALQGCTATQTSCISALESCTSGLTNDLQAHIDDPYAAHPASAISIDSAYASNVQEALDSISDQIGGTATSSCFVDDTTCLYPSASSNLKICVDTGCSVIIAAGAADRCITLSGSSTINCLSTNLGCTLCIDAACVKSTCFDGKATCAVTVNDGAITAVKLATGAVTSDKIATGALIEEKISNAAVSCNKIASGAVTTVKIADSNVTTAKIADNAVTAAKMADITSTPTTSQITVCNATIGTTNSVWYGPYTSSVMITDKIHKSTGAITTSTSHVATFAHTICCNSVPVTVSSASGTQNAYCGITCITQGFIVPKSWCWRIDQYSSVAACAWLHDVTVIPIVG